MRILEAIHGIKTLSTSSMQALICCDLAPYLSAISLSLQKKCGGALGPVLMSSSGLASAGPLLSNKFGSFIESRQKSILNREFPESGALSEEEAQLKYQVLLKLLEKNLDNTTHAPLLQELVNLREEHKGLDTLIFHQTKKIEYTRLVAGQQARTAPLISSMGFASGILTTLGYHAYRNKPKINNRLGFAGDCTVIPAEAIALLATPAAALKAAMYERALSKKNENPSQLLTKRMEELNKLEKILTVSQAAEP